jgi:hypothetical protein
MSLKHLFKPGFQVQLMMVTVYSNWNGSICLDELGSVWDWLKGSRKSHCPGAGLSLCGRSYNHQVRSLFSVSTLAIHVEQVKLDGRLQNYCKVHSVQGSRLTRHTHEAAEQPQCRKSLPEHPPGAPHI